jgi:hypothetical protein
MRQRAKKIDNINQNYIFINGVVHFFAYLKVGRPFARSLSPRGVVWLTNTSLDI